MYGFMNTRADYIGASNMNNQELSFDRRWELNFRHICNCLLVADADGDGNLEISAGSRDGVLCVYKFDQSEPWRLTAPTASPSGSIGGPFGLITALAVGDLFNKKMTVLVSISADGACFACRLGGGPGQASSDQILQACFKQCLPSNIKAAHICDIDGDGRLELIVALTDRVVRTYRFLACATPTPSTTTIGTSSRQQQTAASIASSGTGFCCGYLVALNKWESPAQITAFSVCPSGQNADSGVTVLLSQPGDKYLLLKPKLCPENDPSDNLSDISVVYCETNRPTQYGGLKSGGASFDKGHVTEHRTGHKSISKSGTPKNGKVKRRLFVAANSDRIDFFHLISRYVTIVDHNHEHRIDFPTQIFTMTPLKVLSPPYQQKSDENGKSFRELLLACDWTNNIYVCSIDGDNYNSSGKEDEKQHKVASVVTMKAYGPVMGFAAGYSESTCADELFLAVSTCEEKLFVYSVRVSKILRALDNR